MKEEDYSDISEGADWDGATESVERKIAALTGENTEKKAGMEKTEDPPVEPEQPDAGGTEAVFSGPEQSDAEATEPVFSDPEQSDAEGAEPVFSGPEQPDAEEAEPVFSGPEQSGEEEAEPVSYESEQSDGKETEPVFSEQKRPKKKKKRTGLMVGCILLFLVVALGVAYTVISFHFREHFYYGTVINGIEFGDATAADVQERLTREVNAYSLTLREREGKDETISGQEIDLHLLFDTDFQAMLDQQSQWAWITGLFQKSEYTVGTSLQYDDGKLSAKLGQLNAYNPVLMITPINASVFYDEGTGSFAVDPGTKGSLLNSEVFPGKVHDAITNLQPELDLEAAGCYVPQTVDENNEALQNALNVANVYNSAVVHIDIYGNDEVCDGSVIHSWIGIDEAFNVTVSEEQARAFMDVLGDRYNTYGTTRTFPTSGGGTTEITKGDYGWRMNRADTTVDLINAASAGGEQHITAQWLQTANAVGPYDWGNTYVEVSIESQHVWFYKNGELIIDTPCVTGDVTKSGRSTDYGIYSLKFKEKDRILRGDRQSDGSWGYQSHVDFWMPFNGGEGLHDASWRGSFGGSIYRGNGSHGCVNLPRSAASTIYDHIDEGTPVIVH